MKVRNNLPAAKWVYKCATKRYSVPYAGRNGRLTRNFPGK